MTPSNKDTDGNLSKRIDEIIIASKQEEFAGHHKVVMGWERLHTPTLKTQIKDLIQDVCLEAVGEDEPLIPNTYEQEKFERNTLRAAQRQKLNSLLNGEGE